MNGKAWFVFEPRRVDDLSIENRSGKWMEYEVVKTICLSKIDYENFSTDLLADRQFIEDSISLCRKKEDCLLVTGPTLTEEMLIIPWNGCYVRYAALRPAV
jgi:hypothetical protein